MNVTRTIIGIATAAALAAGGGLGAATPATASTKASGSMTYTMTKVAAKELNPAGISVTFGQGGKGLSVTGVTVVDNETYGQFLVVKLSGQVVFSKGSARYAASGLEADWYVESREYEDYGSLGSTGRIAMNLLPIDRKVNVKVDKAKKTRTTTRTVTAYLGLSTEPKFADRLNQALKTEAFFPGMPLGKVTFVVSTTAPCKNSACTK